MNGFLRVLLIDDDEDERALFLDALADIDNQISCEYFNAGELALKWLAGATVLPDYIFLDLNMPKMNGLEVLAAIKTQNHIKSIPVIIYSTSSNDAHKHEAKSIGAASYIVKPYTKHDLKKAIQSVFQKFKP